MFSVDEFITKVRRFGRPRAGDDDEGLDWKRVGERAFQFSARVQSIDFMQVSKNLYPCAYALLITPVLTGLVPCELKRSSVK